jgi:enamine deaminase RidA (YjgF/YER057c/UK114 family)
VSLAEDASVIHPDDHRAQTRRTMQYIDSILDGLQRDAGDLVRLTAFYAVAGPEAPEAIREEIRAALPEGSEAEISVVGLGSLAYPHMVVEIECQFERGV